MLARKRCIYNFNSGINISKHDIIPIVDYAWKNSFAEEESNRSAITVFGWNLLNYDLLNHTELKNKEMLSGRSDNDGKNETNNNELTGMDLIFRSGYAGCVVFELL